MAKVKIPDLKGMTVEEAYDEVTSLELNLGLCKTIDQWPPSTWDYNLSKYWSKIVKEHNENTEPGAEMKVPGTVGVTLVGGLDDDSGTKSPSDAATGGKGTTITINIHVCCDGTVDVSSS